MSFRHSLQELISGLRKRSFRGMSPHTIARMLIGLLVLANIAAALIAFKPWAASIEEMEQRAAALRSQARANQLENERLRANVAKVDTARRDGDRFLEQHILDIRTASSTLVNELAQVATKAGIRQKGTAFSYEPVEGAEDLTRAIITGEYEGSYADLMHFLNLLDRSPRFLIVESLSASPQQDSGTLSISLKLNAFVREGGTGEADERTGA
ncbi:MAG: GspMb/PilO family protein [bacterium]|jgi:Tfp pilus assembly protein PilO